VSADWNKGAMSIGGSTITQQLAKNLYLSPRRSLIRKVRELLIAFSLEDHLGKQRILELYLNVVEWGDGVFGAEAAARTWFHHSAQALSPAEAVRLAVALPNPITRAPNVRDPELTRKAVRLIRVLRMEGLLGAAQERTALDEVGAPDERVLPDREVTAGAPDEHIVPNREVTDDGRGGNAPTPVAPSGPAGTEGAPDVGPAASPPGSAPASPPSSSSATPGQPRPAAESTTEPSANPTPAPPPGESVPAGAPSPSAEPSGSAQ
jgi:hypothetical protein